MLKFVSKPFVAIWLSIGCSVGIAAPFYNTVDIGPTYISGPRGYGIWDADLNNNGDILVGLYPTSSGSIVDGRSFIINGSSVTSVGAGLLGQNLNDSRQVSGYSNELGTFLWSNGQVNFSNQRVGNNGAINSAGQFGSAISLYSDLGDPLGDSPILVTNGQIQILPKPDGSYSAHISGLNDFGMAVGSALYQSPVRRAEPVVYSAGAVTTLGTFGGTMGEAHDVNNSGMIVGGARDINEVWRGFISDGSGLVDIGSIPGWERQTIATHVNESGVVVGSVFRSDWQEGTNNTHAFIYDNSVMRDLNDLTASDLLWDVVAPLALNDHGQILAVGLNKNDVFDSRLLLLCPIEIACGPYASIPLFPEQAQAPDFEPVNVPEPASFALLALGLAGLGATRRRSLSPTGVQA